MSSPQVEVILNTWLVYSHKGKHAVSVKTVAQMARPAQRNDASWLREVEGHLAELQGLHKLRVESVKGKPAVVPFSSKSGSERAESRT